MLEVINVKGFRGLKSYVVYIGRSCGGWVGSVLGNPFVLGEYSREESISLYKRWVWNKYQEGGEVKKEIDRLVFRSEHCGEFVELGCWCIPKNCHGDVIKDFVVYLGGV